MRLKNPYLHFGFFVVALAALIAVLLVQILGCNQVLAWIAGINIAGLLLTAIDKSNAFRQVRRIPEKILLGTALIGGSPGVLLGMRLFRHKTKKVQFQFYLVIVILFQIIIWKIFRY